MQQQTPCKCGTTDTWHAECYRDRPRLARLTEVTDAEIAAAFDGANFGRADHRKLLALSILKKALRYHCGHTITEIMITMGMTTRRGTVTERGRYFCYVELDGKNSG
jgi:hypothetical protein